MLPYTHSPCFQTLIPMFLYTHSMQSFLMFTYTHSPCLHMPISIFPYPFPIFPYTDSHVSIHPIPHVSMHPFPMILYTHSHVSIPHSPYFRILIPMFPYAHSPCFHAPIPMIPYTHSHTDLGILSFGSFDSLANPPNMIAFCPTRLNE